MVDTSAARAFGFSKYALIALPGSLSFACVGVTVSRQFHRPHSGNVRSLTFNHRIAASRVNDVTSATASIAFSAGSIAILDGCGMRVRDVALNSGGVIPFEAPLMSFSPLFTVESSKVTLVRASYLEQGPNEVCRRPLSRRCSIM